MIESELDAQSKTISYHALALQRMLKKPGEPEEKTGTDNFFIVDQRLNG